MFHIIEQWIALIKGNFVADMNLTDSLQGEYRQVEEPLSLLETENLEKSNNYSLCFLKLAASG